MDSDEIRRTALQIATQLPENTKEAFEVLEAVKFIVTCLWAGHPAAIVTFPRVVKPSPSDS